MCHFVVCSQKDFFGLKSLNTTLLTICLLLSSALPVCGHAQQYSAYMYKNDNRNVPITHFSPSDTIGVRLTLEDLPEGQYTLHADWYNAAGELQETSRYRFTKQPGQTEVIDAQLNIIKASPLRRLFSSTETTGYHMKFYGKWRVKLFLNGKAVASKDFEVK